MNPLYGKSSLTPVERQSDDIDVRDIIRKSDDRARRFFEAHIKRPLFPYSEPRMEPTKTVTSGTE